METSWPFDKGDGQHVDPPRWQSLMAPGTPSGVVGRWGDNALSVSVSSSQVGAVDIAPGRALIRGFAYKADQPVTLALNVQTEKNPRVDLVVIELDMASGKAAAKILKGQPAPTPVPPGVRQIDGGIWQYPLAQITVRRSQTAVESIRDVRTLFDSGRPPAVGDTYVPTNPTPGDLAYYKSRSTGAEELHMYAANGGWSIAASLGKSRPYSPKLGWSGGRYSAKGHYQWISSNTMWFTANVTNTSGKTWAGHQMNVSLPTKSRGGLWQVATCTLYNNDGGKTPYEGMPNYLIGTAYIHGGSTCQPVLQTYHSAINGGDWWERFPKGSTMIVTGTYEADYFHEGNA
ncbi:hypothetical protein [Streptomyces rimosus]|uniref:hypothetical protein n=1 Tax=Streptomyces rimosus TaxID=1927 RepID=UPI0004BE76F4|nr:hypothetical protein [Streptomyces rimosus]